MAQDTTGTNIDFPELAAIRKELAARFHPRVRAKFLGAALTQATKPTANALKQVTKQNFSKVSGNLLRSVTQVVRRYPKTGNAVGLVGFTKAGVGSKTKTGGTIMKGKDRAYHAGLLVFGTKRRRTKGPIASSYSSRGPFVIKGKAKRGKFAGSTRVRTTPKYPKAFFKRGSGDSGVDVGQIYANDVITQTLRRESSNIRRVLREQMSDVVERAARYLAYKFPTKNT